jgi:hypothetical protein
MFQSSNPLCTYIYIILIILYHIILYYIISHYIISYYIISYHIIFYYMILYYIILYKFLYLSMFAGQFITLRRMDWHDWPTGAGPL